MKRNCREFVPGMEMLDARWKHPFTCVVARPSGSRKSTFIRHLMLSQEKIIMISSITFIFSSALMHLRTRFCHAY